MLYSNLLHVAAFVAVLACALVVLHSVERRVSRGVSHALGWNAVLFTGWIGVPLHEISHLIVARIFRHRVVAYRLFDPDPVTGTLGYVRHAYSRRNPWQLAGSFFIGISPLLAGLGALTALLAWMVPVRVVTDAFGYAQSASLAEIAQLGTALLGAIWHHRTEWLPLQLYLALCIASHTSPSATDLKNGAMGAVFLVLIVAAVVYTTSRAQISLAAINVGLVPLIVLVMAVSGLQFAYLGAIRLLTALGRSR